MRISIGQLRKIIRESVIAEGTDSDRLTKLKGYVKNLSQHFPGNVAIKNFVNKEGLTPEDAEAIHGELSSLSHDNVAVKQLVKAVSQYANQAEDTANSGAIESLERIIGGYQEALKTSEPPNRRALFRP